MQVHYAAFGLKLHSSFQLAGMSPDAANELPELTLELVTPEELGVAWSGPSGPPEWQGRLGDGRDLRIERGTAGDTLFVYGERARFLLDPAAQRLECAPSHGGLDWQRALIGKGIP